jgi:hypothetical protein
MFDQFSYTPQEMKMYKSALYQSGYKEFIVPEEDLLQYKEYRTKFAIKYETPKKLKVMILRSHVFEDISSEEAFDFIRESCKYNISGP